MRSYSRLTKFDRSINIGCVKYKLGGVQSCVHTQKKGPRSVDAQKTQVVVQTKFQFK